MSSKFEEILWKSYIRKLNADRDFEINKMKFESLQITNQIKLFENKNKSWEEKNKSWEEKNKSWEEKNKTWEEKNNSCEEKNKSWAEKNKTWEEKNNSCEEKNKSWAEKNKLIEEKNKAIEEKNKAIEEKNKLIENEITNLKKQNEELKKQIQTKSETAPITDKNTKDIWEAINKGSLLAVKYYYIDNPENISKKRNGYPLPIHQASRLGHFHIVEFILSKGIEINKIDDGDTPLMCALKHSQLSVVNYLLDKGAELNHRNRNEETALTIAAQNNNLDIVKLLIDKGANKVGALHIAASRYNCVPIIEFLLSRGAEVDERDSKGFTPLTRAAEGNHSDIVKLLVDKGANKVGALHIASRHGYLPMIEFLLSRGAEVDERDSKGFTPLMRAAELNYSDIVKLLVDKGANKVGALHIASRDGYLPMIEFLLSRGADVDEKDSEDFTPLMRAAEENYLDIVKLLVDKGANKMLKNKDNQTVLDLAKSARNNMPSYKYPINDEIQKYVS